MFEAESQQFLIRLADKGREEIVRIAFALYQENRELFVKLTETQRAGTEMAIQFQQMRDELHGREQEVKALQEQILHLTGIRTLQSKELFGRSTEKTADILDQASDPAEPVDPLSEDSSPAGAEAAEHASSAPKAKVAAFRPGIHKRKKTAGKKETDLSGLPVSTIYDYDIEELNQQYGEGNWYFAFWHEHKTVEVVRQTSYLLVRYTPVVSVGLEHVLITLPYENALIQKSLASASLLASIMLDKYSLYLPLYRQEQDGTRFGFPLSRQTMSNWTVCVCERYLKYVYLHLCKKLAASRYQQCDETTWSVIHDGRRAGAKSYIWAHRTSELAEGHSVILYCYELTRGTDHLREFYTGQEGEAVITSDAYGAYSTYEKESGGRVTVTGCLMHARRRFVQALDILNIKDMPESQFQELPEVKGIRLIADIYHADEPLKALSAEERREGRDTVVRGAVDAYFDFIHGIDLSVPGLSERLKDAVTYSRNQEACLRRFLEDGNIPIDNGACERSIKPVALLRRNSLFSNTVRGAEANVIVTTLIETAKANQAEPYYYLKYLMVEMPSHPLDQSDGFLDGMMPWSSAYRRYEEKEKAAAAGRAAPPGNARPKTPRQRDKSPDVA